MARPPKIKKMSPSEWREVLMGTHPGLYRERWLFSFLPSDPRCKFCNSPFSGFGGKIMSFLGRAPYSKNPLICGACLTGPVEGTEVEITMLFADVRGSTGLAEKMSASAFAELMRRFYDVSSHVLVHSMAIVDKFVGDEVIGLYIPGLAGHDHPRKAILAAEELLRATGHEQEPWLPIGIGVHTGVAYVALVGSQGDDVGDFTALGDNMNITARLASSAGAGEILVSEAAYNRAEQASGTERRTLDLKGRSEPVGVHVVKVKAARSS